MIIFFTCSIHVISILDFIATKFTCFYMKVFFWIFVYINAGILVYKNLLNHFIFIRICIIIYMINRFIFEFSCFQYVRSDFNAFSENWKLVQLILRNFLLSMLYKNVFFLKILTHREMSWFGTIFSSLPTITFSSSLLNHVSSNSCFDPIWSKNSYLFLKVVDEQFSKGHILDWIELVANAPKLFSSFSLKWVGDAKWEYFCLFQPLLDEIGGYWTPQSSQGFWVFALLTEEFGTESETEFGSEFGSESNWLMSGVASSEEEILFSILMFSIPKIRTYWWIEIFRINSIFFLITAEASLSVKCGPARSRNPGKIGKKYCFMIDFPRVFGVGYNFKKPRMKDLKFRIT